MASARRLPRVCHELYHGISRRRGIGYLFPGLFAMKTTVDIDTELLDQAKQVLKTRTIKATVDRSLEAVIR